MWVLYSLLFFVLYAAHCSMARRIVSYYTAISQPFHWNLYMWNQDVQYLISKVD